MDSDQESRALTLVALAALVALLVAAPTAAAATTEFPLPEALRMPNAIAVDAEGDVWVTLDGTWAVARIDAETGSAARFPLAGAPGEDDALYGLALARDGAAWTASRTQLHRVDAQSGNVTAFDLPASTNLSGDVWIAEDGTVWAALVTSDRLVALDPESGSVRELEMPRAGFGPLEFEDAGAGRVFLTATYADTYALFDPEAETVTTGPADLVSAPTGITFDGTDLWIGEHGGNSVVRVDPETGESEKLPTAPSPYYPITGPSGLVVAPDGAVWFAIHFADRIARLDPATRTIVEYELPSAPGTNTQRVALGPDGKVWFAEWTGNRIGYATYGGETPDLTVPERVTVTRGGSATFTVDGAAGRVVIGAHDPTIKGTVDGGTVTIDVGAAVPAGTYNLVVSEKRDDGKTYVGQYMTLVVEEDVADGGSARTPAPHAALGAVVVFATALTLAQRGGRRGP